MQTTKWGPSAWDTFFIFSRNYPEKYNPENKEHLEVRKHTKRFYQALVYILPCKYCRLSFKDFWKEVPIEDYLDTRNDLTFWVYTIKDLVNKKLIFQEKRIFEEAISKASSSKEKNILKKEIFITIPSPPFCEVVKYYEQYRAGCSAKTKSCRNKKK